MPDRDPARPRHCLPALLTLAALIVAGAHGSHAAGVTQESCDGDRRAMVEGVARNRETTVQMLQTSIAAATTDYEREHLRAELERAWDLEEEQRALADRVWRDCLAYLRREQVPAK